MCPVGTYNRVEAGTCDECADVCVDGCSGPLNTAGEGGCNRCSNILIRDNTDEVSNKFTCSYNTRGSYG